MVLRLPEQALTTAKPLAQLFFGCALAAVATVMVWPLRVTLPSPPLLFIYPPFVWMAGYFGGRIAAFTSAALSLVSGWLLVIAGLGASAIPVAVLFGAVLLGTAVAAFRLGEAKSAERRALREQELLAAIVASSHEAILSKTLDGVILSWNAEAERMYGYTAAEAIGRPVSMLAPPERQDEVPRILDRLRRGERVDPYETVRVKKDGTRIDILLTVSPVKDTLGRIFAAAAIAQDITVRKQLEAARTRAEETLRRKQAEDALVSAIAAKTAGETELERMLVATLEQLWSVVRFTGGSIGLIEDGDLVIKAAVGPFAGSALGQRMPRGPSRVWQIVDTGEPFLSNDLAADGLSPTTPIKSYLGVPLVWYGRPFGVLEVDSSEPDAFSAADVGLLQRVGATLSGSIELARRYAAEVLAKAELEAAHEAQARLHELERRAREDAEHAARRTSRLQAITAALSEALTPEQVAEVILDQGTAALGAQVGSVSLLSEDGSTLELVRAIGYPEEFVHRWRTPLAARPASAEAIQTREPVFCESRDALVARYGLQGQAPGVLPQPGARAVVPLVLGRDVLGVLSFLFPSGRAFTEDERALIQTVARQCVQALERARLYEREHRVAATLQQALLPADLPQFPGIALYAAYLPGAGESEVGGDWYDAFRLPNGDIALSVGDVLGRGLPAAVIMGQLRQAIRVAALEGHGPPEVLTRANSIIELTSGTEGMATALFGIFDPVRFTFTYAAAGHPAPVLATPDGAVRELQCQSALPLGVGRAEWPSAETVSLPLGSLLVLYTDGLIEWSRNLEQGEAALLAAVGAERERPAPDPSRSILERVLRGQHAGDDIALVTLSIAPAPLERMTLTLPADPSSARQVRHAFQRLAAALDMEPDLTMAVQVALGEAVTNVVEHAYAAAEGIMEVRAWREAGSLVVEIEDRGRWRPERDRRPGYGLQLMRALVDSVEITQRPSGTVVRLGVSLGAPRPSGAEARQGVTGGQPPAVAAIDEQVGDEAGDGTTGPTAGEGRFAIRSGVVPSVVVAGDVDLINAGELGAALDRAARADQRAVVVDLTEASFLDSKAIRVLLRFGRRLSVNRQRLFVIIPRRHPLRRLLEVAGVTEAFPVCESFDEALAQITGGHSAGS